jgi:hypothetical protein
MGIAVWALGLVCPAAWPPWARLIGQVAFGALVYVALIHGFRLESYREVRQLAAEQLPWGPRSALPERSA